MTVYHVPVKQVMRMYFQGKHVNLIKAFTGMNTSTINKIIQDNIKASL